MNIETPKNTAVESDYTRLLEDMRALYKDKTPSKINATDAYKHNTDAPQYNKIDELLHKNSTAETSKDAIDTAYADKKDASTMDIYTIQELQTMYVQSSNDSVESDKNTFWSTLITA